MIYKFKDGSRFGINPQVAGEELERIGAANRGQVVPAAVVDAARPEDAPLHPEFEWDDPTAAELYREEQARCLIRSVVRVEQSESDAPPKVIQAYVHVRPSGDEPCYMPTSVVMRDDDLREQALADARSLLQGARRRLAHLDDLPEVLDAIDRAKLAIDRARLALERPARRRDRRREQRPAQVNA